MRLSHALWIPLLATGLGYQLPHAGAATFSWAGNQNGLWCDPALWSPLGIPGAADVAVIAIPGARPVIEYSATCGSRQVGGVRVNDELRVTGGTLTLLSTRADNRFDPSSIFRISGGVFSFKASGTLDIDNEFFLTAGRLRTENFSSTVPAGIVSFRGAFNQSGGNIRTDGDGIVRFTGDFAGGREHFWSGGTWDGSGVGTFEIASGGVMNIAANDTSLNTLNQFIVVRNGELRIDGRNSGGFGGVGMVVGSLGNIENQGVFRILCDGSGVRAIEGTPGGVFSNVVNRAQGTNFASFENPTGGTAPLGANLIWENQGTVNIMNAGGIDYQGFWDNISGYVTVGGGGVFRFGGGATFAHTGYGGGSGMRVLANNTVRFGNLHTYAMQTGNLVFDPGSSMIVESGATLDFSGPSVLIPGHVIADGGNLILAKDGGNAGNQFGASAARLTVNPGGVVTYGQSHQVQDGTGVNINAGTINLMGFIETFGALSLSNGARINGPGEIGLVAGNGGFIQALDTFASLVSADLAIDGQLTVQVPALGLLAASGLIREKAGALASGITKTGGGELKAFDLDIGNVVLNQGITRLDGTGVRLHNTRSLSVSRDALNQPAATLDLTGDALEIDYAGASPVGAVRSEIQFARNGGLWNRPGITSSWLLANDPQHSIGYGEAADVLGPTGGLYLGEVVDGTTVLMRYTRLGDANLSGIVDIEDFARLAARFNQGGDWSQGDFNYSGFVDIGDFAALAANYNRVVMPFAERGSTVPEPALSLIVPTIALLARRRYR